MEFIHPFIHSFILQLFMEHLKEMGLWIYSSEQNNVFLWSLHPDGWSQTIIISQKNIISQVVISAMGSKGQRETEKEEHRGSILTIVHMVVREGRSP